MDAYFNELVVLSVKKEEVTFYIDPIIKGIVSNKSGKIYNVLEKHLIYALGSEKVKITFKNDRKAKEKEEETWSEEGLNPVLTFENFLYTDQTKNIIKKGKYIADSVIPLGFPVFIFGSPGSGKSHFVNAIGNQIGQQKQQKILYVQANELAEDVVRGRLDIVSLLDERYYSQDLIIIDDFQNLENKPSSLDNFFKIFEKFKASKKQLIITSDKIPSELKINERYYTRLQEGLTIEMPTPDIHLKKLVFKYLIEKNEFHCSDEIATFVAKNASNLRELTGYINNITTEFIMLDGDDIDNHEEITMSMALKVVRINDLKNVSFEKILAETAGYFGVSTSSIKSKNRSPDIVYRRRIAVWLCHKLTNRKQKDIAIFFNYKDHTAVVQSVKHINTNIDGNEALRKDIETIEVRIKNRT